MDTRATLSPRWTDAWLRGWPGLSLVVAVHLAIVVWAIGSDRFLHDEGLLTHLFASATAQAPAAGLFLQKSRPPISALYAGFAAHSLQAFLYAHAVVGSFGVLLLGRAALGMGHRAPNLVAAILALSPLYIGGAAAGLSNTDVVVGICLCLWLAATQRRVAAAVVLGMLPWIRAEVGVLAICVAAASLHRRDVRVLLALVAFGVTYALAGMLYHLRPDWFLAFPPALPDAMPGNPYWATHAGTVTVAQLAATALALCPALPLLAWLPWRRLSGHERLGMVFVVGFVIALVALPRWRVFNFDQSPRYLLPIVPFVALAVGRVYERWLEGEAPWRGGLGVLAGCGAMALVAGLQSAHPTALVAVAITGFAATLAHTGRGRLAVATLCALVALGPAGFGEGGGVTRQQTAPHLDAMVSRLETLVGPGRRSVYTNEPLLHAFVRRSGRLPGVTVFYLVQEDQRFELDQLTNEANGQRAALWAAIDGGAYGRVVRAGALRPDAVPTNAVFALSKDERLPLVMPPEVWDAELEVVHPGYRMVISQMRGAAAR